MSDVYMPGISSRFNTDQIVENLMKVERVPRDRVAKDIEKLESQKTSWQDLGRRISALRESARFLFSFQNPFSERKVISSDPSALTGTANRQAFDQELSFRVQQIAKADRFLSDPLDGDFQIEAGTYTFTVGPERISFNFRGGSLNDFVSTLNTRGQNKIKASLIAVQRGSKSLLIESLVTGAENRLGFEDSARDLAVRAGLGAVSEESDTLGVFIPRNPVSTAQDAILNMDGIEISRPENTIDDLVPGVTLTVRAPSERSITLKVEPDREAIKDAIISLVGNYNRLMAEINILTRTDTQILDELSYLSEAERTSFQERLGIFAGDSTLTQFRTGLQRAVTSPYMTLDEGTLGMLAQIGISTDARGSGAGGYDASRLRGYLEIDEQALDTALAGDLSFIQRLFGYDTDGDLVVDSGVAYTLDQMTRPYVETGGIISLKTGTIDSKIKQDNQRIETLDRQLAAKEADLKSQYAQMESAYAQMEQMTDSLSNWSLQNSSSNR
ncbi:MAG: flagellar filament capping protein FliD [Treponema sp.]|jgi:flagellar capping protein FliD|nr:flagellar filament capping protein FliD [Treponema sp.]